MKENTSKKLFLEAQAYIPGGVNSPVRACKSVEADPLFIMRGRGARIWDADDNEYLDYVGSWGPLILGHGHAAVRKAVNEALERGASFGAPTTLEIRLAKALCDCIPSMDKVRMVNSESFAIFCTRLAIT